MSLLPWTLPFVLLLMTALARATPRLLIYSATTGFRHTSIPFAIDALQNSTKEHNLLFDATEDESWFTDEKLSQYDAVVFLSTTGEVLDEPGKDAFQRYLNKGGNFVGLHAASDCLNTTEFYKKQIGAYFDYHPPISEATVQVLDASHPSTRHLPKRWTLTDEMYNFKSDPRAVGAVVILSADESSYTDDGPRQFDQGNPHPIAWYQERGAGVQQNISGTIAGRSFYTALGHNDDIWQNETFIQHILGGINWALQSNTTRAFNESGLVGASAESSTAPAPSSPTTQTPPSPTNQTPTTSAANKLMSTGTIALAIFLVFAILLI